MISKQYYIYIVTNKRNTTVYCGVTDNLVKRVWQHKNKTDPESFTAKYNLDKLVYYEVYEDIYTAISREKQMKGGSRKKKIKLIQTTNPIWRDLYQDIV